MEMGFITFIGFWLLWHKLSWVFRLKLLGQPFWLDLFVTVAFFTIYGHTAEGLITASIGALIASVCINMARKTFGFYQKVNNEWFYFSGKINIADKIIAEKRRKLL